MDKRGFLPEKYADLPGSKPVERAVAQKIRSGDKGPNTKQGRVEAYMDRLEHITDDDRGFELLKHKLLTRFTINPGNVETLEKIAEGLYESEKRMAIEQGRGRDVEQFESTHDVIEHYKPLIREKAEIQRKTLSAWVDYLKENDAMQPMWFRYFVVRSLERMGTLDKEKMTYSKRTSMTVAPFPELNSEALGWVYKRLNEGVDQVLETDSEGVPANEPEELTDEQRQVIEKLVKSKDFAKLYAFAQIETAGKFNRESIEGDWKKYDQGSDYRKLENDLKGKGTGWCTAEGSAQKQIANGDFYVYYTKGEGDSYTQPRVAIRMEGDHVAEVRGVSQRQELEPELVDIAQEQYRTLPGGEVYDKKATDMKAVTALMKKQEQGQAFTKDELIFLYEINAPIEGFGYDKDPRVAELRKARNAEADSLVVFECDESQIAHSVGQINESTKAYVGKLEPWIFDRLPDSIEHVYTSFPEGKIRRENIEIGGQTSKQLQELMQNSGIQVSGYAKFMMDSRDFATLKEPEPIDLVRLKVGDLDLSDYPTTDEIYARIKELGLELCPAEVGPQYRLAHQDQPMNEFVFVGMKQIPDQDGYPSVFNVVRFPDGLWLYYYIATPGSEWNPVDEFLFRLRKKPLKS